MPTTKTLRRGKLRGAHRSFTFLLLVTALTISSAAPSPAAPYDRPGKNSLVSLSSADKRGTSPAVMVTQCQTDCAPSISADGRFVAFASRANGLTRDDTNMLTDVFVRDRKRGTTELISKTDQGMPATGACTEELNPNSPQVEKVWRGSFFAAISSSGRYVAFASCATNLVPGDTNNVADVFVYDRRKGSLERVSVDSDEQQADKGSGRYRPSISADGLKVTFASDASLAGEESEFSDVFVRDRERGQTVLVSAPKFPGTSPSSAIAQIDSRCPSISADGTSVVFWSNDNTLVANDTNEPWQWDIFKHNLARGKAELVTLNNQGEQGLGAVNICSGNQGPSTSENGRYVAFIAGAANLVPNDDNDGNGQIGCADAYVRDTLRDKTERLSVTSSGQGADLGASTLGISGDGRYVAFSSPATNLWEEDESGSASAPEVVAGSALNRSFCPHSNEAADAFPDFDVFIHDRDTGATEPVSVGADGDDGRCDYVLETEGEGQSLLPSVSRTGRFVAFWSCNEGLSEDEAAAGPPLSPQIGDQWVRDRGAPLGANVSGSRSGAGDPSPEPLICISDVCVPPGTAISRLDVGDDLNEVLTGQGANLHGAALAYRPQYRDLFAAIELERMPKVLPVSPIFYGLRFKVGDKHYEVRATSLNYGTFGLFDCTGSPTCTKVTDLRGGYGTTGERVVFSLPLEEIGLNNGGQLKKVKAFSGVGSYMTGATKVLDRVRLK